MWSVDAYNYIEQHHPTLWIDRSQRHVSRLVHRRQPGRRVEQRRFRAGAYRAAAARSVTTSRLCSTARSRWATAPRWATCCTERRKTRRKPGWGGRFVRDLGWAEDRLRPPDDRSRSRRGFGVVEFVLPVPDGMTRQHTARMVFDGRIPAAAVNRREGAAVPLFAARREGVAVCDSRATSPGSTASQAHSRPCRRPPIERVDRRPRTRTGGLTILIRLPQRASIRRKERQPMARAVPR